MMYHTFGHLDDCVISAVITFNFKNLIKNLNSIMSKGCEGRKDLLPKNLNGWFWSANREKIQPTNRIPVGWVN